MAGEPRDDAPEDRPGHIPPKHLLLLAWFLQAVRRSVITRLAISLPPGTSKSTMASCNPYDEHTAWAHRNTSVDENAA